MTLKWQSFFGIPIDDRDKEKKRDEAANDGDNHLRDEEADIDLELLENAAVHVDDAHDDELVKVYDKEDPVIEVGRLFPSMDESRMCFRTYAVKLEFATKTMWTDKKKFYAKCIGYDGGAKPCKWYISARRQPDGRTVGVRSMENKKILPHANKQAKIYLLDCSNESIQELTLEDSNAVNESTFSWVM